MRVLLPVLFLSLAGCDSVMELFVSGEGDAPTTDRPPPKAPIAAPGKRDPIDH